MTWPVLFYVRAMTPPVLVLSYFVALCLGAVGELSVFGWPEALNATRAAAIDDHAARAGWHCGGGTVPTEPGRQTHLNRASGDHAETVGKPKKESGEQDGGKHCRENGAQGGAEARATDESSNSPDD